jgi:hypothetical protein
MQERRLPGTICSENRYTRIHAVRRHDRLIEQLWGVDLLDSERELFIQVVFLLSRVGKCDIVECDDWRW